MRLLHPVTKHNKHPSRLDRYNTSHLSTPTTHVLPSVLGTSSSDFSHYITIAGCQCQACQLWYTLLVAGAHPPAQAMLRVAYGSV